MARNMLRRSEGDLMSLQAVGGSRGPDGFAHAGTRTKMVSQRTGSARTA